MPVTYSTLISVIIPVYNGEKTIRETIDSVIKQTFDNFELIVINDGSTDSTLDIVNSIQDSRIKVFSYDNAGQSASRNWGISLAKGEYISFIDADDLWTPDKLESQLQALQENPQAAVAYSWTDWIDEAGEPWGRGIHISESGDVYGKLLLNDFVANGSNVLIKSEALKEVGGFETSLIPAEDWDMWIRLASRYHFVVVPSPQILYRVYTSSCSGNIWKMESSSLRIIEKAFANAPSSVQHLQKETLGNRYKYLTFKAVEHPLERKKCLAAIRFLSLAIKYDPSLILKAKVIALVIFKIVATLLLPSPIAHSFMNQSRKIYQKQAS